MPAANALGLGLGAQFWLFSGFRVLTFSCSNSHVELFPGHMGPPDHVPGLGLSISALVAELEPFQFAPLPALAPPFFFAKTVILFDLLLQIWVTEPVSAN